ncbi:hypothetical protein ABW19_dt0206287 [Dactylella cylindrospora]|nr:hypothetical protein ABW19_dt0206287 [Dactylella cylindrospora]
MDLTPSRTILLAAHLASKSDISSLRSLVGLKPAILNPATTLDILLRFLPEAIPPQTYAQFVKDLVANDTLPPPADPNEVDISYVAEVSEPSAARTLEALGFPTRNNAKSDGDILTPWLHARARAIDREIGAVSLIDGLVSQFIETGPEVYGWYMGTVSVLCRLVYLGGVGGGEEGMDLDYGLEQFEGLPTQEGVKLLLSGVTEESVGNAFEMVVPYVAYRRRKAVSEGWPDPWGYVFDWLVEQGREKFGVLWRVVRDWEGPDEEDVRGEYWRSVLTGCYISTRTDEETVQQLQDVVHRVAGAVGVEIALVGIGEVDSLVDRFMTGRGSIRNIFSPSSDFEEDAGELVAPTPASLRLLELLVVSTRMFALFPMQLTVREVMRMRFTGSREDQLGLLKRGLMVENAKRGEPGYRDLREACRFLREDSGVLGRLGREDIEVEILRSMLAGAKFMAVTTTYLTPKTGRARREKPLLPMDTVEKVVIHSVLDFYDKSTNGNRNRGGMKNASNALAVIHPAHSDSLPLRRLAKLLAATHALSEYSLTLTPGVPLKPVQIRLYHDPPDLISRVLQSNTKAYLQLDSLVKIAADLVYGVSKSDAEPTPTEAALLKSRITGMCVEAALAEDDFETAFSYVMNKLVPNHKKMVDSNGKKSTWSTQDTAWQAALQAGRYRSPAMLAESIEGVATSKGIEQVQKRMELLSQALVICPAEAMMDVLGTWKRCEEELEGLLELEVQEERVHAGKLGAWASSLALPMGKQQTAGGGGEGLLSKGPMSLLSVASSAGSLAKSFGSSAFPLRGHGNKDAPGSREGSQRGSGEYERGGGWTVGEDGERVRKRDVLSGMVTSGLASGLGWVLGAKPEDMNQGQR